MEANASQTELVSSFSKLRKSPQRKGRQNCYGIDEEPPAIPMHAWDDDATQKAVETVETPNEQQDFAAENTSIKRTSLGKNNAIHSEISNRDCQP
jgi:hypothetical protein